MLRKLQRIKEESQNLCSQISSELSAEAKTLAEIDYKPPFKTLEEFDDWFNSDQPLRM